MEIIHGKFFPDRYLHVYYSILLILSMLVVLSCVCCLWITGMIIKNIGMIIKNIFLETETISTYTEHIYIYLSQFALFKTAKKLHSILIEIKISFYMSCIP